MCVYFPMSGAVFFSFIPAFTMKLLYCLILQRSHKAMGNRKRTATPAAVKNIAEDKYVHGQWALDIDRISVNTLFHTFFLSLSRFDATVCTEEHFSDFICCCSIVFFVSCWTNTTIYKFHPHTDEIQNNLNWKFPRQHILKTRKIFRFWFLTFVAL